MPAKKVAKPAQAKRGVVEDRLTVKTRSGLETGAVREAITHYFCVDAGNGKGAAAWINPAGMRHMTSISHARRRVTGERVDRSFGGGSIKVPYADFIGNRWGYGDAIWDLATDSPVDVFVNSVERYGTDEHVFYVLLLAALSGLPSGSDVNLVITVPPGFYNRVKLKVENAFKAGEVQVDKRGAAFSDGWWTITLHEEKEARRYRFSEVYVVMEGADTGYSAYLYNAAGVPQEITGRDGQHATGGRIRIIDLGFGTADTPTIVDGLLSEDNINSTSDSQGGILVQMVYPIMEAIRKQVPNATLSPQQVDAWLRDWANGKTLASGKKVAAWSEEAAQITLSGYSINLHKVFWNYARTYATYVYQTYLAPALSQNIDAFLAVGGGWLYIVNLLRDDLARNNVQIQLLTPENVAHLEAVGYIHLNAVGALAMVTATLHAQAQELG